MMNEWKISKSLQNEEVSGLFVFSLVPAVVQPSRLLHFGFKVSASLDNSVVSRCRRRTKVISGVFVCGEAKK